MYPNTVLLLTGGIKEGNKNGDKEFDQKVAWLRQVLEWQDTSNPTGAR